MKLKKHGPALILLLLALACLALAGCAGSSATGSGSAAVENAVKDDNRPPEMTAASAIGLDGAISVNYSVADHNGDTCSVRLYYSEDGGTTYTEARDAVFDTAETSAVKKVTWRPPSTGGRYKIRLVPFDGRSEGTPALIDLSPPAAAAAAQTYKVAFASTRGMARSQIYLGNSDGSAVARIPTPHNDTYPFISGDGSSVVFVSDRDVSGLSSTEVYIMACDGSGVRRLTASDGSYRYCNYASLSPDGRLAAFTATASPDDALSKLCVVSTAGGAVTVLRDRVSLDTYPRFSPDGKDIVFSSKGSIYTIPAAGGTAIKLAQKASYHAQPSFSPDGKRIFFCRVVGLSNVDIYSTALDGSGEIRLTNDPYTDMTPVVSPDGATVLFVSERSGKYQIMSMDASGKNQKTAFGSMGSDSYPSFGAGTVTFVPAPYLTDISIKSIPNIYLASRTIDLTKVECVALYSDNSTKTVKPEWSVAAGTGKIANNSYKSPWPEMSARLRAAYAENGIVKYNDIDLAFKIETAKDPGIIYSSASGQLCSIRPDGTGFSGLTSASAISLYDIGFWNPSGSSNEYLTYSAVRLGNYELYAMNLSTLGRSLFSGQSEASELEHACSPDGKKLYFVSNADGDCEIYSLEVYDAFFGPTAYSQTKLTDNAAVDISPDPSRDGKTIFFSSNRDGGSYFGVYSMNADGSGQRRLSGGVTYNDTEPRAMPDGSVVFTSDRDGSRRIYAMNADGSGQRRLSSSNADEFSPRPSPDGSFIAFAASEGGGAPHIFTMDTAGVAVKRLTAGAGEIRPAVSRDGSKIAYLAKASGAEGAAFEGEVIEVKTGRRIKYIAASSESDSPSAYVSEKILFHSSYESPVVYEGQASAGKVCRNIYSIPNSFSFITAQSTGISSKFNDNRHPSYSKSSAGGISFTFTSDASGNDDIYLAYTSGAAAKKLTTSPARDYNSSFSKNNALVAFVSERDGNPEIYTMKADGTDQRNLTRNPAADISPNFSPDGTKIVFASSRNGNSDIFIMASDGTDPVALVSGPADEADPAFSADGLSVVFVSDAETPGKHQIYTVSTAGGTPKRVTFDPSLDFRRPYWSAN